MKELSGQNREKFYCIFSNLLIDNLDSLKCAKNVLCKLIYEKNVSSKIQQYYRSLESNNSTFYTNTLQVFINFPFFQPRQV